MAAHPNNRPPEAVVRRATEDDWRGPGESIEERRLVAMWVHPEHRGGRIGSCLVTQVEEWARDAGALAWCCGSRRATTRHCTST